MTIARNAASLASNWANGVIGSTVASGGGLKRGNVGITDSVSYDGTDPEYGTGRDVKAKLVLSNGQEIWDISGNVWQHVRRDEDDTLTPQNRQPGLGDVCDDAAGTGCWGEFTDITDYRDLTYDIIRPFDSALNANYGVGRIWTYGDGETATTDRVFLRGGDWDGGTYAGVFTLGLFWDTSNQNYNVGFRCAR